MRTLASEAELDLPMGHESVCEGSRKVRRWVREGRRKGRREGGREKEEEERRPGAT